MTHSLITNVELFFLPPSGCAASLLDGRYFATAGDTRSQLHGCSSGYWNQYDGDLHSSAVGNGGGDAPTIPELLVVVASNVGRIWNAFWDISPENALESDDGSISNVAGLEVHQEVGREAGSQSLSSTMKRLLHQRKKTTS